MKPTLPNYIRFYRYPATTQERRLSADPEISCMVRAKRNHKNLADAYDDVMIGRSKIPSTRQRRRSNRQFRQTIRRMMGE